MYKQKQVGPFFHHKCTRQATQPRGRLSPGHRDRQLSPEVASAPRSPQPSSQLWYTSHALKHSNTAVTTGHSHQAGGNFSVFVCVFLYIAKPWETKTLYCIGNKLFDCTVWWNWWSLTEASCHERNMFTSSNSLILAYSPGCSGSLKQTHASSLYSSWKLEVCYTIWLIPPTPLCHRNGSQVVLYSCLHVHLVGSAQSFISL